MNSVRIWSSNHQHLGSWNVFCFSCKIWLMLVTRSCPDRISKTLAVYIW